MTEYPEIIVELAEAEANAGRLKEALLDTTASLVAAVSLLKRGGKKAAASDKMFAQMLADYGASIERARAAIAKAEYVPAAVAHSSGIPDTALVQDLELSVRSIAVLKRGGLLTVGDVRSYNDEWLKGLGLSKRFLNEVRELIGYCEERP